MRIKLYRNASWIEAYQTFDEVVKDGYIEDSEQAETEAWEQLSKGEVVELPFGIRVEPA